ncbi:hypothetical protein JCM8202_003862 [Rhodotorula sphaerocarpa]
MHAFLETASSVSPVPPRSAQRKGSTAIGQSAPDAISVFVRKAAEARQALLNTYLAVADIYVKQKEWNKAFDAAHCAGQLHPRSIARPKRSPGSAKSLRRRHPDKGILLELQSLEREERARQRRAATVTSELVQVGGMPGTTTTVTSASGSASDHGDDGAGSVDRPDHEPSTA